MNNGFKSAGWALLAGVVGTAIACLTAPASGAMTRRRIARGFADKRDGLVRRGERTVGRATDYVERRIRQGRRKLSQLVA